MHLTFVSQNRKTGPIAVSTNVKSTCPDECPLKNGPCYARFGPLGIFWSVLSKKSNSFKSFIKDVKSIPKGKPFRINQAGDLPGNNNSINAKQLRELANSAKHTRAWTYTHKPVTGKYAPNAQLIKEANKNITINLSADNLEEADELKSLNIGPVVVTLKFDESRNTLYTPKGNKVIVCPQQNNPNITCASCMLCQKKRSVIIGFKAHGVLKKHI
jgi:hypothetical protein